ncbi:MAG: FAD:protein FMN transferase [Nanoarchaeota archaeon]|nr:FAD:protein FMN transferase [Nanoarchaeota archaeon]
MEIKRLLIAISILGIIILSGCLERLYEVERTEEIMGTFVKITIYDKNTENAEKAIDEAFMEIMRIDDLLSNFKEYSEVYLLNENKEIEDASQDLIDNIQKSIYYGELSEGRFDITVQPILDLYKESFQERKRPPTDDEIKEEMKRVDYTKIRINGNKISIDEGQKITLGGIAKGYAVDKAIEILRDNGIEHALVNAGGDMRALGKKYGSLDWFIALANPRDENDYIKMIKLADKAIVTSGDYERYFDENKSFHHIVNPKTGYSASELISVTIIADNAFDADAISTSVFVLGKEKGIELIESLDNVEGLIITEDREIIKSSEFD